jgi:hypothetical protein
MGFNSYPFTKYLIFYFVTFNRKSYTFTLSQMFKDGD